MTDGGDGVADVVRDGRIKRRPALRLRVKATVAQRPVLARSPRGFNLRAPLIWRAGGGPLGIYSRKLGSDYMRLNVGLNALDCDLIFFVWFFFFKGDGFKGPTLQTLNLKITNHCFPSSCFTGDSYKSKAVSWREGCEVTTAEVASHGQD